MDESITVEEQLTIVDLLKPWPHHLHVMSYGVGWISACDCGWFTDTTCATTLVAAQRYREHIERCE